MAAYTTLSGSTETYQLCDSVSPVVSNQVATEPETAPSVLPMLPLYSTPNYQMPTYYHNYYQPAHQQLIPPCVAMPTKCGFPCSYYCPMKRAFKARKKPIISIPPTSRWQIRAEPPGIPYQKLIENFDPPAAGWLLSLTMQEKRLAFADHVEKLRDIIQTNHMLKPKITSPGRVSKAKVTREYEHYTWRK